MEKKTIQRIIGILVVIALIIILIPLLFSKNDVSSLQPTTEKAPPFPDQQNQQSQVAPSPAASNQTMVDEHVVTAENSAAVEPAIAPAQPTAPATPVAIETTTLPDTVPAQSAVNTVVETKAPEAILSAEEKPTIDHPEQQTEVAAAPAKQPVATPKTKAPNYEQYRKTAWVVQLGSFNNKDNARKLTDKLRAAGYKAFTREVSNSKHGTIRVYVGPEFKRVVAIELSAKIQREMNLHNFVVKYKPLEL